MPINTENELQRITRKATPLHAITSDLIHCLFLENAKCLSVVSSMMASPSKAFDTYHELFDLAYFDPYPLDLTAANLVVAWFQASFQHPSHFGILNTPVSESKPTASSRFLRVCHSSRFAFITSRRSQRRSRALSISSRSRHLRLRRVQAMG